MLYQIPTLSGKCYNPRANILSRQFPLHIRLHCMHLSHFGNSNWLHSALRFWSPCMPVVVENMYGNRFACRTFYATHFNACILHGIRTGFDDCIHHILELKLKYICMKTSWFSIYIKLQDSSWLCYTISQWIQAYQRLILWSCIHSDQEMLLHLF